MDLLKTPYEISVWEDRLTYVDIYDNEYDEEPENLKTSYFKEIKLFIIGSDKLNTPINIFSPKLQRKVDGTNVLTFSINMKYYDEINDAYLENPFVPYLVNERKIKLKYYKKGQLKWLDFLIKNIEESSENYQINYTATDLFLNELSKSGFNLVFDSELENNQGTINQLAEKVLEGTDWQLGADSEVIKQYQEEALYHIVLKNRIEAKDFLTDKKVIIDAGEVIYGFYSSVINNSDIFQFLYDYNNNYEIDDSRVARGGANYYLDIGVIDWFSETNKPSFVQSIEYVSEIRGLRFVKKQKTVYDNILERYVEVFSDSANNDTTTYGYLNTKYLTEDFAQSFITNGENYSNSSGWKQNSSEKIKVVTIPSFQETFDTSIEREIGLEFNSTEDNFLFNSGVNDNAKIIEQIAKEEDFIFRTKCKILGFENQKLYTPRNTAIHFSVRQYELDSKGSIIFDNNKYPAIIEGITEYSDSYLDPNGCFIGHAKAKRSISQQELKNNKYGIFIQVLTKNSSQINIAAEGTFYFQEIQMFKLLLDSEGRVCLPNGLNLDYNNFIISEQSYSKILEEYHYYYPTDAEEKDEISYIYIGEKNPRFKPRYGTYCEKIRSINQSNTNRFNLLQELSETFQCWCRFDIKHKETGEILLGKDLQEASNLYAGTSSSVMKDYVIYNAGNSTSNEFKNIVGNKVYSDYQQQKFITFHEFIGQENSADFVYGINLKSIKRTVESDEIVSKLIVNQNNNEFAENGSCNISLAKENPSGESFLYNFDYYINQKLLNGLNVYKDLYSLTTNREGLYVKLRKLNSELKILNDEYVGLNEKLLKAESDYQVKSLEVDAKKETVRDKKEYFYETTNCEYEKMNLSNSWYKENFIISLREEINRISLELKQDEKQLKHYQKKVENLSIMLEEVNIQRKKITEEKNGLIKNFEKKYCRFIQEGEWSSEDYTDHNLYYLDSESTLYNSSRPKIGYTISIVELGQIEEYSNYSYDLGDITHVQDPEFFGWRQDTSTKTPYREKVVVTEITTYFEEPEKDEIKIQNYRTQFEDLFQRVTAASQKIELYSGAYTRAANVINSDGTIDISAIAPALSNNTSILENANNQSVTWDDKGITTRNLKNPNEIVRIISGGIFLTDDGGNTWATGITGQGINAKIITTGQLNTNNVTILNGNQGSFRWDSLGINAYEKDSSGTYNNRNYVRFDQYGIYGMRESDENFEPGSESEVWEKANFALTWKGFMLKKQNGYGSIIIDSEKDINLLDSEGNELIHIGYFDQQRTYGIRILDENKETAFLANQNGLYVGGWKVLKNELSTTTTESNPEDETQPFSYSVKLFSADSHENHQVRYGGNSVNRNTWRILVSDQFGVDREGRVYADTVFSGGLWIDATETKRIKLLGNGIIVETRSNPSEDFKKWREINWDDFIPLV